MNLPDAAALLDSLGLRPITVPQLGRNSILLVKQGIILVDAEADLESVADHALTWAVEQFTEVTP